MPRIVTDDAPKAPSRGKRGGLSVTDLRKRLKALGLKVAGTKAELEARYQAAVTTVEDASTPVEVSKRSLESEEDHKTVPSSPSHPSPKRHKVETSPKGRSPRGRSPEPVEPVETAPETEGEAERSPGEDFEAELAAELEDLEHAEMEKEEALLDKDVAAENMEGIDELQEHEDLLPDRYRTHVEQSPHQDLINLVMRSKIWWWSGLRSLVRNLVDLKKVEKHELPKKMDDLSESQFSDFLARFQEAVEAPLKSFSNHLKPALARRIHVGTMDYMGGSHESYRRTFEFIEMTNTWFDLDSPSREVSALYRKKLGCSYKDPEVYKALARRAVDPRDSFRMVVKVSCVATHVEKLQKVQDWWPKLWREKYSHLAPATVAFLWQFPPSFVYSDEIFQRLERLVEYLASNQSGVQEARHIVDFRDGSWYREDVYDFLRRHRWCLAWLHLNNRTGWASNLPSGWTDRVQTTNFCFCRLFGPDGQTHGSYDNKFLHELFDSCPMGTTTYVLFGNKETLEDPGPDPPPATLNAVTFRTIFTKMDFVERIREVRYRGACPRILSPEETLLINSFYLRFSQKARAHRIKVTSPVCSQWTQKYKPLAPLEKRSYEWYFPETDERLHLGLHDAKEEEDLWIFLRQLTGLEDMQAAKDYVWSNAGKYGLEAFRREDVTLLLGSMVRWSEKARMTGLLSSTKLCAVDKEGKNMEFLLSNNEKIWLSVDDMKEEDDLWKWLLDLSRVPSESLVNAEEAQENDPWKDGSWKSKAKEMWERPAEPEEAQQKEDNHWWQDSSWGKQNENANQATQSAQDCWMFQQGKCWHGVKCRFSHGEVPTAGTGQRGQHSRHGGWQNSGKVTFKASKDDASSSAAPTKSSFWGDS